MQKPELFDLDEIEVEESTTIEIMHPVTGDPLPGVKVEIYGQDSEIYRSAQRKAEAKYTEYSRRHNGKLMPPEMREELDFAKVVSCTKSISGLAHKGKALTDVAEIFKLRRFIYEQVVQGIMDRAGFIKGSSAE